MREVRSLVQSNPLHLLDVVEERLHRHILRLIIRAID
jgi:hypothetical protein